MRQVSNLKRLSFNYSVPKENIKLDSILMRKIYIYDRPCMKSPITWNMHTPCHPNAHSFDMQEDLSGIKKNITVLLLFS